MFKSLVVNFKKTIDYVVQIVVVIAVIRFKDFSPRKEINYRINPNFNLIDYQLIQVQMSFIKYYQIIQFYFSYFINLNLIHRFIEQFNF